MPKTKVQTEGDGSMNGATLSTNDNEDDIRDFEYVHVVLQPSSSSAASMSAIYESIQLALDDGLDVIFTPGIYQFEHTLHIKHSNTVLLGLGMATLIAPSSAARAPIIKVASNISNVRIAGFILEATTLPSAAEEAYPSTLLIWGDHDVHDRGDKFRPGVISDVFCRVGGSTSTYDARKANVDVMIQLYSSNIVVDHLWLWRTDHLGAFTPDEMKAAVVQINHSKTASAVNRDHYMVQNGECSSKTGLQVFGDDITIYGLSAEHFTQDMIDWHGDRGQVIFYQSELPYDVTKDEYDGNYVSYRVRDTVQSHELYGGGVYSYFRDDNVTSTMGFSHPITPTSTSTATNNNTHQYTKNITMINVFTRFLNGMGSIKSVVNMNGQPVNTVNRTSRVELSVS